mmetsp:Transcript_4446/g.8185  ORF Transcript_4446/g.8185 Transcript_4446/m.8185 type:complete len:118 (-) Transcript_4446:164-517(-)
MMSFMRRRVLVATIVLLLVLHFTHRIHSQDLIGVCFLKNSTLRMAQSYCQLASVPECIEGDGKNGSLFQCYLPCGDDNKDAKVRYNCTDYDLECYPGVTCILPGKSRMKYTAQQDGY